MSQRTESTSTFSICHAPMSDGAVALLQVSLDDLAVEKPCRAGWNLSLQRFRLARIRNCRKTMVSSSFMSNDWSDV